MEPTRKKWNERHKILRKLLSDPLTYPQALELFLQQHAEVHSGSMASTGLFSFEDEVLTDLTESQTKKLPDRMDHSIVWILWHLARIEDVTMNMLVAGKEQVFVSENWKSKLDITESHTGNAMSKKEVVDLSNSIVFEALRKYRVRVGRETVAIVKNLDPAAIPQRVSQSRLVSVVQAGAVVEDAMGIIESWGKRSSAGLRLMPPTRHCFIHLNEAATIRKKVG